MAPKPASKPDSARGKTGTPRDVASDRKKKDAGAEKPRAEGAFLKDTKGDAKPPKAKGDEKAAKSKGSSAGAPASVLLAAGEKPQSAQISAEVTTAVMSMELTAAIQAAAEAAAAEARKVGLTEQQAQHFANVVENAAVATIDPSGAVKQQDGEDETSFKSRIETTLARAIKKNAVRVMDLFHDWDADRNGQISKKEFRQALRGLGIGGSSSDHDALFDKWDVDGSGELDYNELNKALRKGMSQLKATDDDGDDVGIEIKLGRGKAAEIKKAKEEESGNIWTAGKWLTSRGAAKLIANAMKLPQQHTPGEMSHFTYMKTLDRARIEELLTEANLSGAIEFVVESVATLAAQNTGSSSELNDKFASTGKFQMTYGSLSLFYGGLESLLGPPKMYKGTLVNNEEKSLFNTMIVEHTAEKDSKDNFESNGGVTTTSETEWTIVTTPSKDTEYPERTGYREKFASWCRVPTKLNDMMEAMEEKCNALLRKDGHSEMIKEELVGGRLYTGPMYVKYNTVLRSKSKDQNMMKLARDLTKGNGYPTTIHAINSCVIKLSKLTKAGKVWRGIKGATLPKEFWVANEMGVRGGIEYAFSSTTTDREQALIYSGGGDDSAASTVFEMQMGMVDRGADLTWLSQYPHEREVLLPPLTGIEALGTDVQGSTLMISSRLSLNLAAHTLEQVLSRRRKMLLDMLSGIELEMRDALGEENVGFGVRVLRKAMSYGPLSHDPEWFNDDENFAHVMQQTLFLQRGIVTEVKKLKVDDPALDFRGWSMAGPSRVLLLAGWAFNRAEGGQGASGGEAAMSVDLRDAKITESEAIELADLMEAQPRLTSIDVRNNESMSLAGANALAAFMEAHRMSSVGSAPRSLCGVTPAKSSIEVPPSESLVLGTVALRILVAELATHVFSEGISAGMGGGKKKGTTLNRRGASAANEWQPLLWAAKEAHMPIATLLLDLGDDINQQQPVTTSSSSMSALHIAAQKGHEEMCKFLIERGIKKDLRDKHNNTALQLAENKQNREIIIMLGGDPDAKNRKLD